MLRLFLIFIIIFTATNSFSHDYKNYSQIISKYDYANISNDLSNFIVCNKFHYLSKEEIVFIYLVNYSDNEEKNDFNIFEYKAAKNKINSLNPNLYGIKVNKNEGMYEYINKDFLITVKYMSKILLSGTINYDFNDNVSINLYTDALYRMAEMLYGYYNERDGMKVVGTVKIKF